MICCRVRTQNRPRQRLTLLIDTTLSVTTAPDYSRAAYCSNGAGRDADVSVNRPATPDFVCNTRRNDRRFSMSPSTRSSAIQALADLFISPVSVVSAGCSPRSFATQSSPRRVKYESVVAGGFAGGYLPGLYFCPHQHSLPGNIAAFAHYSQTHVADGATIGDKYG